jgi:hypothetical protein
METNRYQLAGWLSITMAVLFPLGMFLGFLQNIIAKTKFDYGVPSLGPSDPIMIIFTVFGVYVLLSFRSFLHERYDYHSIDTPIILTIWWSVIISVVSLFFKIMFTLGGFRISAHPDREVMLSMSIGVILFMVVSLIFIGIVDLIIAIRLLRVKESLSGSLRILAYVSLVAGICEISLILAPLSLILVPVTNVVIGLILLREKEVLEFV